VDKLAKPLDEQMADRLVKGGRSAKQGAYLAKPIRTGEAFAGFVGDRDFQFPRETISRQTPRRQTSRRGTARSRDAFGLGGIHEKAGEAFLPSPLASTFAGCVTGRDRAKRLLMAAVLAQYFR
jgi:hypothetical protein